MKKLSYIFTTIFFAFSNMLVAQTYCSKDNTQIVKMEFGWASRINSWLLPWATMKLKVEEKEENNKEWETSFSFNEYIQADLAKNPTDQSSEFGIAYSEQGINAKAISETSYWLYSKTEAYLEVVVINHDDGSNSLEIRRALPNGAKSHSFFSSSFCNL